MTSNATKQIVAHGGPVSASLHALFDAQKIPWLSDGSDVQEWRAAVFEANRALSEGFNDRTELLELSTAAYRGPVELARRMRRTKFGREGFHKRGSLAGYLMHLFGKEHGPDGMYAAGYAYVLQAIRPFIRSVH